MFVLKYSASNLRFFFVATSLFKEGNKVEVYEAVQPVKMTNLTQWIERGERGSYVIKRLKNADTILTEEKILKMREIGEKYMGKPYDLYFEWGNERIYCSELIWKIYKESTGCSVGKVQRLKDFDLSSFEVKKKLQERYGEKIPINEPVISPQAIFESEFLKTVVSK